jgi:hypothetical protein
MVVAGTEGNVYRVRVTSPSDLHRFAPQEIGMRQTGQPDDRGQQGASDPAAGAGGRTVVLLVGTISARERQAIAWCPLHERRRTLK